MLAAVAAQEFKEVLEMMGIKRGVVLRSMAGALLVLSACAPAYRSGYGRVDYVRYGPGIDLYGYSPDVYGDWRYNYQRWSPVVIYEYDGSYYPNRFRRARPVEVYRGPSGYFLPPRDRDWARMDRRFDSRRLPNRRDYERARRPRRDG